ncbi:Histidine--tRNA ligase, cytoplasmic-like protein [Drosera capensis]
MAKSITLGGKGSSLTSAAVFQIANRLAEVRIDSSLIDKLSSSSSSSPSEAKKKQNHELSRYQISFPDFITLEESRASMVVLLNKLVLSGGVIRSQLVELIGGRLNFGIGEGIGGLEVGEIDVTEEERRVIESCLGTMDGICGILDHEVTGLVGVIDVVAALSCEALKADVSVFGSLDLGDGFSVKSEAAVGGDLRVLLNGSKLVGKVEVGAVSDVPSVHGSLREAVKAVHSRARVEFNSGVRGGKEGNRKAWLIVLMPLAMALRDLGESSLHRAKLNVRSIASDDVSTSVRGLLEEEILKGNEKLVDTFRSVSDVALREEHAKFLHGVNSLLSLVRRVVSLEMVTAVISLEGSELLDRKQEPSASPANVNGGSSNAEKKGEKKRKKAVLGKGTAVIVQLIKDRLQSNLADVVDELSIVRKAIETLDSLLDPKGADFDDFSATVKEIVESNESRRLPKLPKGTRDFAKEQMAVRERQFSIITNVFKRHGAMALDTPAFELKETLTGKYGEDSKLIYDLADQGGELCSLRYDLTVPFARYVAMNGLTSFKRYQIAKVYRRDNPSKGRFREFYQCDFDIAGQFEKMGPDFEIIKILTELLNELEIGDYEVKLNHRKLLDGMLEICGVPPEKFRTICSSIDKLDKQSFDQVKKEMVEEKGLTVEIADRIGTFVNERGPPLELLSKFKQGHREFWENEGSSVALNELEILFKALEKSKCIDKVIFDLSLARGLDYYTGVIYEAVFKGTTQVGSIAAGGRYDNLIGMFGTKQVPAVGVSLGIERVFAIKEQEHKEKNEVIRANETQVLVSILGDDLPLAAELVSELWDARIKAEYMVHKNVIKHLTRANKSGIPLIVIVGEHEIKEGIVKLKELGPIPEDAVEATVPRSRFVEEIQARLLRKRDSSAAAS